MAQAAVTTVPHSWETLLGATEFAPSGVGKAWAEYGPGQPSCDA
jgi:hypothetical protein